MLVFVEIRGSETLLKTGLIGRTEEEEVGWRPGTATYLLKNSFLKILFAIALSD